MQINFANGCNRKLSGEFRNSEWMDLYVWITMRTGKECDFIVVSDAVPRLAIQVCYDLTAENRRREVGGLLNAPAFFRMAEGVKKQPNLPRMFYNIPFYVAYL